MPARSKGLASPFPARVASLCASQLALMSLLLDLRPIWLKTEMELLSEVAEILKTHTGAPAIRERLPSVTNASPTLRWPAVTEQFSARQNEDRVRPLLGSKVASPASRQRRNDPPFGGRQLVPQGRKDQQRARELFAEKTETCDVPRPKTIECFALTNREEWFITFKPRCSDEHGKVRCELPASLPQGGRWHPRDYRVHVSRDEPHRESDGIAALREVLYGERTYRALPPSALLGS